MNDVGARSGLGSMVGNTVRRGKRLVGQLLGIHPKHAVQVSLPTEFYGTPYGGWYLFSGTLSSSSTVYSFGVGDDVSFDLALIDKFGLHVYGFDPTPLSIDWVERQTFPPSFHFYPLGISDHDGWALFAPPSTPGHVSYSMTRRRSNTSAPIQAEVRRLQTISRQLGHKRIDVLKMDIEGAEYSVLFDILDSAVVVDQLLVEFHYGGGFGSVSQVNTIVRKLNAGGYAIYSISPSGHEYSFVRCDLIQHGPGL